jgi:hypothetical protein
LGQTPAQQTAPPPAPTTGTSAGGGVSNALVTLSGGLVQSGSFATAVSATPMPGGPRRAFTNGDGRFVFNDLDAGLTPHHADAALPRRRVQVPELAAR